MAKALELKLTSAGFTVDVAFDGQDALQKIRKNQYDLILLDLIMPKVDGFEVLKKIKTTDSLKSVPVIIFSNLGQKEDIEKAKSLGAEDFLIKANFTLDDVVAKINGLVAK